VDEERTPHAVGSVKYSSAHETVDYFQGSKREQKKQILEWQSIKGTKLELQHFSGENFINKLSEVNCFKGKVNEVASPAQAVGGTEKNDGRQGIVDKARQGKVR